MKTKIVDSIYLVWLGFALAGVSAILGCDISDNQTWPAAFMGIVLAGLLIHIVNVIREVAK